MDWLDLEVKGIKNKSYASFSSHNITNNDSELYYSETSMSQHISLSHSQGIPEGWYEVLFG